MNAQLAQGKIICAYREPPKLLAGRFSVEKSYKKGKCAKAIPLARFCKPLFTTGYKDREISGMFFA
jgi:hypothetical protein